MRAANDARPDALPDPPRCDRCDGCGRIASSEDGEPWTDWTDLPPGSDLSVRLGLVQPLPCPACGGSGTARKAPSPPAQAVAAEPVAVLADHEVWVTLGGPAEVPGRASATLRAARLDGRQWRPSAMRAVVLGDGGASLRLDLFVDDVLFARPFATMVQRIEPVDDAPASGSQFRLELDNVRTRPVALVVQLCLELVPT